VIQALASFLCDVLNEININSSIDDLKTEKNFIFKEHIKYYQKEAVIIYDRHYADYSVLASHAKSDSDFVIRCPTSNTFRKIEEFIKSDRIDEIVALKVTEKQKKFVTKNELAEEVMVRLIKVKLDNAEIEVIMTSLLDREKYKVDDFKP
jgi:hypothetical protein